MLNEAKMNIPKYSADDMKKLPLRAIVALAARCARRVEHLALPPGGHPGSEACRQAVSDALGMAENFARGLPCPSSESVIHTIEEYRDAAQENGARQNALAAIVQAAYAAATAINTLDIRSEPAQKHLLGPAPEPGPHFHLKDVTADLAALCAFTAAVDAADATGYTDSFIKGAVADYRAIDSLRLGHYPEAGRPIDPSAEGPLGPYEAE
jgi:hypothetical protein